LSGYRLKNRGARLVGLRPTAPPSEHNRSYGRGASILSIGIAATGLLTFAFFSISSHVLSPDAASRVALLWSIMFVIVSVIYRPIEQLLSRTIAEHRALGYEAQRLRVPIVIQMGFALLFLVAALALHETIVNQVFEGYEALYGVLLVGTLAYAASYFARGWLAGHEYFALFGSLVLMEATARICFALAVVLGITSGQTAVALGIAAAPLVSLVVVPAAFARSRRERREAIARTPRQANREELSLRRGTHFAGWVSSIMFSEQTLLNAAVLTVAATSSDKALAGIVFDVLLIARAPLQLFQAIQTSLLPHLTGLEATEGHAAFAKAIRVTVRAIAAFAAAVALGLLAIGPFAMSHLFGQPFSYGRFGLALVGVGMGLHLASGTLNQAALARNRARAAAGCWGLAAILFLAWMLTPAVSEQLLRMEIGYAGATAVLALALGMLYRGGGRDLAAPAGDRPEAQTASTARVIAR
jgi:O-antigen/teichoic acid export membrane protein